jgi:hypothetical protein
VEAVSTLGRSERSRNDATIGDVLLGSLGQRLAAYPTDPTSGFAYYTAQPGQAGGLSVTVTFANGSQASVTCAGHTGGE